MNIDFISDINKGHEESLNYKKVDQFVMNVLWWHLGVFILVAFLNAVVKVASFYPSPLSWRVISIKEAVIAVIIALSVTIILSIIKNKIQNRYLWRVLVTITLTLYSYLFVYISGGSIEMHFHFFMMAALLVVYADWRLGWILLLFTGLHHGVLNYFEPGWVYYYGRNDFAVIAHVIPVLVTVIFTTFLCITARQSVVVIEKSKVDLLARTDELEKLKSKLEVNVEDKTSELKTKITELESINKLMVDRELKMMELKEEIKKLQAK